MKKYTVEIVGPNGWEVTTEEMAEVLDEGVTSVFGWRAFNNGATIEVTEAAE